MDLCSIAKFACAFFTDPLTELRLPFFVTLWNISQPQHKFFWDWLAVSLRGQGVGFSVCFQVLSPRRHCVVRCYITYYVCTLIVKKSSVDDVSVLHLCILTNYYYFQLLWSLNYFSITFLYILLFWLRPTFNILFVYDCAGFLICAERRPVIAWRYTEFIMKIMKICCHFFPGVMPERAMGSSLLTAMARPVAAANRSTCLNWKRCTAAWNRMPAGCTASILMANTRTAYSILRALRIQQLPVR